MRFIRKKIESDFYYTKAQAGYLYSKQPKSAASRIQWDKLLNSPSSDYWKTKAQTCSEKIKKKIIVSDYLLGLYAGWIPKNYNKIFKELFADGFELYFMDSAGTLLPFNQEVSQDDNYLRQMISNSYLVRKEFVEKQLLKQGEDIQQYYILDNFNMAELLTNGGDLYNYTMHLLEEASLDSSRLELLRKSCRLEEAKALLIENSKVENEVLKQFLSAFFAEAPRVKWLGLTIAEAETLPDLTAIPITELSLLNCRKLKEIPLLPPAVNTLDLGGTQVTDYSRLRGLNLKKLALAACKNYQNFLLNFSGMSAGLEELDLSSNSVFPLPELKNIPLKKLFLTDCSEVELPCLPATMEELNLQGSDVEELPELKHTQLKKMNLSACKRLRNLPVLPASIAKLDLNGSPTVQIDTSVFEGVTRLKEINLSGGRKMNQKVINSLPTSIEKLAFCYNEDYKLNFARLHHLKEIDLSSCKITTLPIFPDSIEKINLSYTSLDDLSGLEKYKNLKYLDLTQCPHLRSLPSGLPRHIKIILSRESMLARTELGSLDEMKSHEAKGYGGSGASQNQGKRQNHSAGKKNIKQSAGSSSVSMDTQTRVEPTTVVKATYGIYKKKNVLPIEPSEYRQEVRDCFTWVNNELVLGQAEVKYTEPELAAVHYSTEDFLGALTAENYFVKFPVVKSAEWVALPLLAANDRLTMMDRPQGSELRYNQERNQLEIKLNGRATTVQYIAAPSQEVTALAPVVPALPETLQKRWDRLLSGEIPHGASAGFAALKRQLTQLRSPEEKWAFCNNELSAYCGHFANEDLSPATAEWDPCLRALIEQKGACRHRAFVYMLICHYLKIPARYVYNEVHAYVEIFDGKKWQKMDLGGTEAILDFKPQPLLSTEALKEDKPGRWDCYFTPKKTQQKEYKNTESVLADLAGQGSALLTVPDTEAARGLYMAMAERSKDLLVYLESARDIEENWQSVQVEANGSVKKRVPGPLFEVIQNGGTLVINWDRFSANEIASYKSLMDKPPTFLGEPVSDKLHLINVVTPQTKACSAFLSRCQSFTWPESIAYPKNKLPLEEQAMPEEKALLQIDLYGNDEDWRARLLGETQYTEQGFIFKQGKLLEAILSKQKKVVLVDAPLQDPHFQRFIHQLLVQRRCFINGETYEIPADFTIHFAPAPQAITRPTQLQEPLDHSSDADDDTFYLNSQTLPLLLKQQALKEHKMVSAAGWLEQSATKKRCLVQTGPLTAGEQRQFYAAVAEQKETIQYVDLTRVEAKPPSSLTVWDVSQMTTNCLIETADPHFVATELGKKAEWMVPIHAQTDAADLMETIELKADNVHFTYQKGVVADALQKGKTVILHGSLSADLYCALEPLFAAVPQLKLATAEKPSPFPGRLILVTTPLNFPARLANTQNSQLQVTAEVLWKKYAGKIDSAERKNFEKIRLFYQLAEQVNHGKTGAPPLLRINYKRLRNMLDALQTKATNDNPIKMFFHYDYDKSSEDYAYLNAMAKALFGPEDQALGCRKKKQGRYPDQEGYFWRRLNCFNASALKTLLPRNLLSLDKNPINEKSKELVTADIVSKGSSRKKIMRRMQGHLQTGKAVVLKGPPGSGKTYLAFEYAKAHASKENIFCGEGAVQAWLEESKVGPDNEAVLIIDEANLSASNFTFLEKLPQLSPYHKVIFTGNPESYPGRYYLPELQDLPTVYVNKWTRAQLKKLLRAFLSKVPSFDWTKHSAAIDRILAVYLSLEKILPPDTLSVRDLQAVVFRYCYFLQKEGTASDQAYQACLAEWGNSFDDAIVEKQFQVLLAQEFPHAAATVRNDAFLRQLPKDYYLSNQHRELLLQIYHDFQLAESTKIYNEIDGAPPVKLGVLLEGASGVGKSRLMRTLLQTLKHTELSAQQLLESKQENLSACFIHFTLTNNSAQDALLLQTAFDKGCKVILDELNLDPSIETLLNHLLTGKTPEGKPATQKGFFVFASQNSVTMEGRQTVSKALKNRFHFLYAKETTEVDLQRIAKQALPFVTNESGPQIVRSYLRQARLHPKAVNMRTFFDGLALIKGHFLEGRRRNSLYSCRSSQDSVFTAAQTLPKKSPAWRRSGL